MKKYWFLLIIFLAFIIGCSKREITLEKFLEVAVYDGYFIDKNKTGYENYDYIDEVYYAINRDDTYDIQFLKLKDTNYAKRFFDLNKEDISKNVASLSYVKDKSYSSYDLYHVETSSTYYLIIRNNENIIYIVAPIGNILEIEEFLDDLELDY